MDQMTYQIESTSFFNLETANQYLFTKLRQRLRYPTSKFDVVKLVLTLIDETTLVCRIPLNHRDELYDFLHSLHYTHGINLLSYYGMQSLQDKFHRAMYSGISSFSHILIRDIETRLEGIV